MRLRLINAGAGIALRFWIDRHPLLIVARDGLDVIPSGPYTAVTVAVGQRLDLMMRCDQDPNYQYKVFSALSAHYFGSWALAPLVIGYGLLQYNPSVTHTHRYSCNRSSV